MLPKKISLNQIDLSSRALAEIFRCSYDKSHLVEDPFVCQKAFCQKIVCKSCYFLINCCPSCGASINSFSNSLHPSQKNMLDQIHLSCENKARGCLVEIDYESYRCHTKNCKYRENFVPVSFKTEIQASNNLIDAEKAFLLEQMSKSKIQFQENNLKSINPIPNSSQPIKPPVNQEKTGNILEKYTSSFVLDFGKKVLSSFASNLESKIIASLNEEKKDEPEKKSSIPAIPARVPVKCEEGPSKLISLDPQNAQNATNTLLNKNPKPKKKIIKNEDLLKFKLEDYEAMTIPELKKILSRRNIPKSGNKSDLINKILIYVDHLKRKGKLPADFYQKQGQLSESSESDDEDFDSDSDDDDDSFEESSKNPNNFLCYMQGCKISDSKLRKFNKKEFENLTVEDLKDLLEQRNIPKTGNKQDLIIKLQQYLLQNEQKKPTKKISKDPNGKKMKKEKVMMGLLEKTNDELKDILYRLGMPVSGNKGELVARILNR